jgi:hypothetical protein
MQRLLAVPLVLLAASILVVGQDASAGKKKSKEPEAPKVGWIPAGTNGGQCWHPPDFASMPEGPKRMAWQETRDQMLAQWRGARPDGVKFDDQVVDTVETVLLAKADRIELVSKENLAQCEKAMTGGGTAAWEAWVKSLAGSLTEGECPTPPMDYTMYDYLSINNDWQIPVQVCKGDRITVHGTPADYYQITKGGPWINVLGDTSDTNVSGLPCNVEGCVRGMLIMRFTTESGVQQILPVGESREFLAPEHGRVDVMINDDSMSDNLWKVEHGVEHHTGIEYKPVEGG